MDTLVPSKTPASFFSSVSADVKTLKAISLEMIAPHNNPASVLQLIIAADAVGISSVNIPTSAQYCDVDTNAIMTAEAKGAKNITSVETTHGVIRSKWPDAPFIYVTAIPNRVCHFPDEAQNNYAQEFPSSHNAGIALKYAIAERTPPCRHRHLEYQPGQAPETPANPSKVLRKLSFSTRMRSALERAALLIVRSQ